MNTIDRTRLASLMQREQKKFVDERPKSKALFERAGKSLLAGVPMNWMVKWAGVVLRCGRPSLHRLLSRRYRRHDRPLTLSHGQSSGRPDEARHHADASQRG